MYNNPIGKIFKDVFFRQNYSRTKKQSTYKTTSGSSHEHHSKNKVPQYAGSSGFSGTSSVESPPKPPKQLYGARIRQRQDFPCDDSAFPQYMRLCENLKKQGKIVECGDERFR